MYMRKIQLTLFNYIYKTVILLAISILISTAIWKTPCIFGLRPMFVVSESMEPAIEKYQFILAVVVNERCIEKGDIVAYEIKNSNAFLSKLVVHRVEEINQDGTYRFKGDNNTTSLENETHIKAEQIKYKVIWY